MKAWLNPPSIPGAGGDISEARALGAISGRRLLFGGSGLSLKGLEVTRLLTLFAASALVSFCLMRLLPSPADVVAVIASAIALGSAWRYIWPPKPQGK